jgi:phosphatidylinositol glycan class V
MYVENIIHHPSYSESLFTLLSLIGYSLYLGHHSLLAAFAWSLSSLVRSNGILYAGFFLYDCLLAWKIRFRWQSVMYTLSLVFLTVSGFLIVQWKAYQQYCVTGDRPWCHDAMPFIYGFVQAHYWYFFMVNSPWVGTMDF